MASVKANEIGLEALKRKRTTTPKSEMPRCPACGSVSIRRKTALPDHPQRMPGKYHCHSCSEHFDEPEGPR